MTDEEKAEEYAQNRINTMFVDESEEVYVRASTLKKIFKNSYLKGLIEGRKELEQWKQEWQDAQIKANEEGFARLILLYRINELKKEKEWLDNTNNEQTEVILQLNEQIEKMKCCGNCKKRRTCIKHNNFIYPEMTNPINYGCDNLSKWEPNE